MPKLPPPPEGLADLLVRARAHYNLTTREVEERTGVNKSMLSRLETGQLKNPNLRVIRALTALYKIPPEVWFE